jgi:hypothetical protein
MTKEKASPEQSPSSKAAKRENHIDIGVDSPPVSSSQVKPNPGLKRLPSIFKGWKEYIIAEYENNVDSDISLASAIKEVMIFEESEKVSLAKFLSDLADNVKSIAIRKKSLSVEECQHLALIMRKNNVVLLDLKVVKICEDGFGEISDALKSCNQLLSLTLTNTEITDLGLSQLIRGLKEYRTIKALYLSNCPTISASGWFYLINTITTGKFSPLTVLGLTGNNFGSGYFKYLSHGLMAQHTPTLLDISNNPIGDQGALAIAKLIANNKPIISCDIGRQTSKGEAEIISAFKTNNWLLYLTYTRLHNNKNTTIAIEKNFKYLRSNMTKIIENSVDSEVDLTKVKKQLEHLRDYDDPAIHTNPHIKFVHENLNTVLAKIAGLKVQALKKELRGKYRLSIPSSSSSIQKEENRSLTADGSANEHKSNRQWVAKISSPTSPGANLTTKS